RRQLGDAAEVIQVKMGRDVVVDPGQAGDGGGGPVDAPGVPRAGSARINQDRLPGGRDNERGAAALDVVPVDIHPVVRQAGAGARRNQAAERDEEKLWQRFHGGPLLKTLPESSAMTNVGKAPRPAPAPVRIPSAEAGAAGVFTSRRSGFPIQTLP